MTPRTELLLGCAVLFVALATLAATVAQAAAERTQVRRSLAVVRSLALTAPRQGARLDDRGVSPAMQRLAALGRRLTIGGKPAQYRRKLELAGNPPRWDSDRVLAVKTAGLAAGVAVGIGAPLALGARLVVVAGVAVVLAVVGYYAVDMWLYQVAYDRRERMRRELPDALDLLTISVEAGLTFDAALSQVARNTEGPLAAEFVRVLQEMQIGTGRLRAMRALSERTELPELRSFVSAMVQADSFGIPVARMLRVQAAEMRVKRSQRAEELAQKVPVKILFPLVFCILPALFIVVIGPAALNILRTFSQL
jgi:tight adherence protein C